MKIIEIKENKIIVDNEYELESYHEQDCCEHVYADFEVLKDYNVSTKTGKTINIKDIDFEEHLEYLIQGIENEGFNMISKIGEKFFIPCYNSQNGYYSSELELILKRGEVKEFMNISKFVEDDIF